VDLTLDAAHPGQVTVADMRDPHGAVPRRAPRSLRSKATSQSSRHALHVIRCETAE
jgi:hypothetical protein